MDQPDGIRVAIFDQVYYLKSEAADQDYMREVARYVNQKMQAIAARTQTAEASRIAVLAALNITDELLRLRQEHVRVHEQVQAKSIEYVALLDEALGR